MRRRRRSAALLLAALFLLLAACGTPPAEESGTTEDGPIQVGLCMDSYVIERWQRDRDVFVSSAKELGMEVLVQNAGGDLEEQAEQVRYLIERQVDAIVIVAVDCDGLSQVVREAKNAGIPIISYDRLIQNADIDLYVSFDNVQVGRLMAENLVAQLPDGGDVICINGSDSDYNVTLVQSGFQEVLRGTGLNIVYNDYCPNWEAQEAYGIMQTLLDSGVQFDAVMCGNDDLASMVYKALSERALIDRTVLVGQDAELSACQRIVSGWQSMTVYKPVEKLAKVAAEATYTVVTEGRMDTEATMNNGTNEVPTILLEPVAVTAENMDEIIIDGGFHLREQVYANQKPG